MANLKYSQNEVIQSLLEVFRKVGYDGASLQQLANATGLKKSSLYHRFPNGKKQMAEEVLKAVNDWVKENIFGLLHGTSDPASRRDQVFSNIKELYAEGKTPCILGSLCTESGLDHFSPLIQDAFDDWLSGFTKLGVDFGLTDSDAEQLAEEVIIKIQGSLVVSRGVKNHQIFLRAIESLRDSYKMTE